MHGDFSRDSHDPKKNFTRVLMQQGRLLVDADWNEQSAIILNYLRALAADVIGWHGGPSVAPGTGKQYTKSVADTGPFLVRLNGNNELESVAGGRYYLDGLQITEDDTPFNQEADRHIQVDNKPDATNLPNQLIYVDAYEQHVVAERDGSIRDDAFGGLETTSRSHLVTRIRLLHTDLDENAEELKRPERDLTKPGFRDVVIKTVLADTEPTIDSRSLRDTKLPHLIAWTNLNTSDQENCVQKERAGYTGLENQLYRVEVHHAGSDGKMFWDPEAKDQKKAQDDAFTLKWSRDNGSVVYAATAGTTTARLKTKWRDESRAIRKGDLVELITPSSESGTIVSVTGVQEDNGDITIEFAQPEKVAFKPEESIIIRRWDHRNRKSFPVSTNGGFLVREQITNEKQKTGNSVAIPLEDGVVVQLSLGKDGDNGKLQAGDYWLIPARAATGNVIWPRNETDSSKPKAVPARYAEHHYAPIALINAGGTIIDLRRNIAPVAS